MTNDFSSSLSVVIPVYNELDTWRELLRRVEEAPLPEVTKQIILVDDCSSDGTRDQLQVFAEELPAKQCPAGVSGYKVLFHEANGGKGAALRTGFAAAEGDFVIIQDADLEYDPNDYAALLPPLLAGEADVVYGSRFVAKRSRSGYRMNYLANRFLTWLTNRFSRLKLTDMETCYKVFPRNLLQSLTLEQNRFGFEPEITAKLARRKARIIEIPISYDPRGHEAGKKIGWKDGLQAIRCIFRYGLFKR